MQRRMRVTVELATWVARLNAQVNSLWHSSPAASAPRWLLGQIGFWVARPGLDAAYQRQLVALARSRRAVADVATSRKRLELQIGGMERSGQHDLGPHLFLGKVLMLREIGWRVSRGPDPARGLFWRQAIEVAHNTDDRWLGMRGARAAGHRGRVYFSVKFSTVANIR